MPLHTRLRLPRLTQCLPLIFFSCYAIDYVDAATPPYALMYRHADATMPMPLFITPHADASATIYYGHRLPPSRCCPFFHSHYFIFFATPLPIIDAR